MKASPSEAGFVGAVVPQWLISETCHVDSCKIANFILRNIGCCHEIAILQNQVLLKLSQCSNKN